MEFIEKKYKTEKDPETGLLRIIALRDFSNVKAGDKGGLIEREDNLSQEGDCWVYDNASVRGWARVYGSARVSENAKISGNAWVCDNAHVYGDAMVCGKAKVQEEIKVCGNVKLWCSYIYTSIENSKDYIILGTKDGFRIFPSNIKNLINKENISTVEEKYIQNIKTIRQIYGEEI